MKKETEINYYNPKEWNNFLITMTAYEWNDYKAVVIIEDHKSRIKLNNSNCMLSLSYSARNLNISKLSMYVLRISPESNHDENFLLWSIYITRILDINIVFILRRSISTNWKKLSKLYINTVINKMRKLFAVINIHENLDPCKFYNKYFTVNISYILAYYLYFVYSSKRNFP